MLCGAADAVRGASSPPDELAYIMRQSDSSGMLISPDQHVCIVQGRDAEVHLNPLPVYIARAALWLGQMHSKTSDCKQRTTLLLQHISLPFCTLTYRYLCCCNPTGLLYSCDRAVVQDLHIGLLYSCNRAVVVLHPQGLSHAMKLPYCSMQ